ncbi:Titin [Amphibalanus amphitrite]|uniref:Titin n=1 Tax=Amphibalanus amphitrite TaxID=1232801 RepID=A0A6A4WB17_AMPAM|nr:Titin [Amphibalanus amphitrite]
MATEAEQAPLGRRLESVGPEQRVPTTLSTIAVQSGATRIVIALLQSREWVELKVLEMSPELTHLGHSLEEAQLLQKQHDEVLQKLASKQSPVEELLNQADQLIASQKPKAEVYSAMAESLGLAWRDLNGQLESRRQLLQHSVAFHSRARNFSDSMDLAERVFSDVRIPSDSEEAQAAIKQLTDEGNQLLEQLRQLALRGTIDSRPNQIRTTVQTACSQVERWLEELHDRRRCLEVLFNNRRTILDQCRALCQLYTDLGGVQKRAELVRRQLAAGCQLGASAHAADLLLHEHSKVELEAKALQDRALALLRSAEALVRADTYARHEPATRAYAVLEICSQLMELAERRRGLLTGAAQFFDQAHKACGQLDRMEEALRAAPAAERALVHAQTAESLRSAGEPAVRLGNQLLDLAGRGADGTEGVSECLETLQRRLEALEQLCTAHKEESLRQTQLYNDFLEKYNTLFGWMVGEAETFLRTHTDPGQALEPAITFSQLHQHMQHDVEARGRDMEALLDSVPALSEQLGAERAADLQRKAEDMRAQWNSIYRIISSRQELLRPYGQFHQRAEQLQRTLDELRAALDGRPLTEDDIGLVETRWPGMQQQYHQLADAGKAFVDMAQNCKDPYLDARRACLCVESILEHLRADQLKVTETYERVQLSMSTARQLQRDWETCARDSKQTLESASHLLGELFPVLRDPPRPARERGSQCQQAAQDRVPQLERLRQELEQRARSAEKLRDADTGGEADRLAQQLSRQRDHVTTVTTEYQMTLQMMQTYFKNVAELDSGIEKQRSAYQSGPLPSAPADCQKRLQELESSRRAFQELFRFAGGELERLEERVHQMEPPAAAAQDIRELRSALDTQTTKCEQTWSSSREQLKRQAASSAFNSELGAINGQLAELSSQLDTMRGQYGETRREAEQTSRAFRNFEDTISNTGSQIQSFVSTAEGFLGESPEPERVHLELETVQNKWSSFHRQVGDNRKLIDLSIQYFKLVEESEDWYKEGGKLLVDIARKTTQIRSPEEAQRLRTEINLFLSPGEQRQEERLRTISVMAEQLYGTPQPERVQTVTQQHRDMVDSLTTVRHELQRLVEKLEQADSEREQLRRHNDQLAVDMRAAQQEADAARAAASAAEEARRAAEAAALALQEMPRPITPLVVPKVDVCTETLTEVTKVTVDRYTQGVPVGTADAATQQAAVHTADAGTQQAAVGTADAATQEIPATSDAATQEMAVGTADASTQRATAATADACTQQIAVGTSDAATQEIPVGTSDAATQKVSLGTDAATQKVSFGTDVSTQNVALVADVSTQKVSAGTDASTQDLPVSTSDAATQKVSSGTDAATQKITMGTDASTQNVTVGTDASTQNTTVGTDVSTQKITMGTDASTQDSTSAADAATQNETAATDAATQKVTLAADASTQESGVSVVDAGTEPCLTDPPPEVPAAEEPVTAARRPRSAQPPPAPAAPLVPPVFTAPLTDRTVPEGERHVLQTRVSGEPAPTVTWHKDGRPCGANSEYELSRTADGLCSLLIEETLVEDSAVFTCRAENAAGVAETSGRLTVRELERGQSPAFSRPLRDLRVEPGRPLVLHATVSGSPTPQVSWLHNGASVDADRRYLTTVNNGQCTLRAEAAEPRDQGVFVCRAANALGFDQTSATVRIQTRVPYEKPQFCSPLSNVMARTGQKLRLECEVTGLPHPELSWLHNGRPVQEGRDTRVTFDGRRATLTIPEAFPKDAGTYVIVAKNEAGEASCQCHVSVKGRLPTETSDSEFASDAEPVKPCVEVQLRDLTVERGQRAQLDCVITGQPEPEVIWYHGELPVKESRDYQLLFHGDRCTLVINSALSEDAGPYSVVAINSAGEASSRCALNVLAPRTPTPEEVTEEPKFTRLLTDASAREGEQEVLEAEVTGTPAPTVTWLKDGREIRSTESVKLSLDGGRARLEIGSCLPQHAGNYICVASNRAGEARCFAHVTVRARPQPVQFRAPPPMQPPVFVQIFKDQHVAEGDDVLYQCIIDGKPKPTVQWLFDDGPLPSEKFSVSSEGQHHVLRIRSAELDHCGRVKCIAENDIGKATCVAQLSVEEPVSDLPPPTVSQMIALSGGATNSQTAKSFTMKKTLHTEVHEQTQVINGGRRPKPAEEQDQERSQEVHSSIAVPPEEPLHRTTYEEVHRGEVAERVEKKVPAKPPRFLTPLQGQMVRQGETARLEGAYTGSPAPEVQWLRDGAPLPADAAPRLVTSHEPGRVTLTVDDVTEADAGRYTCTMKNAAGTATSTADLVVKKTVFPPVFDHRLKAQVAQPGQRVFLEATVSGTPNPQVVWSRDGAPLHPERHRVKEEGSRHILVIETGQWGRGRESVVSPQQG